MPPFKDAVLEHELKRWMRPDAHHFVRADWRRYVAPGSEAATVFEIYERKYREDQLRDWHGRFADEGGGTGHTKPNRVRVASSDKPTLGRHAMVAIAMELAKRAIAAYRSENGLYDLFKRKDGTVSYTQLNGKDIFGSNSTSPTFDASDHEAADKLRDALIHKYPEQFSRENIGQMPNNAIYHAETNALVRAARENGGSLAGRTLEVHVDSDMCNNCRPVLPYVGIEFGNPTVTFVGPKGDRMTMRGGRWITESQP